MRVYLTIAAAASAAALLAGCGQKPAEPAPAADAPAAEAPAAEAAAEAPAAAPAGPSDEEQKALLASLPAPYNTADIENGKRKYGLCKSCHTNVEGGPNMTGPHLYGMFGRTAGTVEGFNYSDGLKKAGFAWTPEKLEQWLPDPKVVVADSKMAPVLALKNPKDKSDVIAYLMVSTGYKPK
jgi:cytochrome c